MNSEDVAGKGGGASKDPSSKPSHDNNLQVKYTVEKEDDKGHQQQVSGAFGDSTNVDEETVKLIMQQ